MFLDKRRKLLYLGVAGTSREPPGHSNASVVTLGNDWEQFETIFGVFIHLGSQFHLGVRIFGYTMGKDETKNGKSTDTDGS